jgi:hypothetical protein
LPRHLRRMSVTAYLKSHSPFTRIQFLPSCSRSISRLRPTLCKPGRGRFTTGRPECGYRWEITSGCPPTNGICLCFQWPIIQNTFRPPVKFESSSNRIIRMETLNWIMKRSILPMFRLLRLPRDHQRQQYLQKQVMSFRIRIRRLSHRRPRIL